MNRKISLTQVLVAGALTVPVLFFSCGDLRAEGKKEITVSAAISLKDAFEKIGSVYEKDYKDVKVWFNFGGSGSLAEQIRNGAPADVFASASRREMDYLEESGMLRKGARENFAGNELVLVVPAESKLNIKGLQELKKKSVKNIAIGNPVTCPAGKYAMDALRNLRIFFAVEKKVVLAENARQILDYVSRNEVDAGFVYSTDAKLSKNVKVVAPVPAEMHEPIVYSVAVIRGSKNEAAAVKFFKYIFTTAGKSILKSYGFKSVKKE